MFKWLFRLAIFGVVLVLLVPGNEKERSLVLSALASAAYKTLTFCDHNQRYCHESVSKVTGFASSFAGYLKQHAAGLDGHGADDVRLERFDRSGLESDLDTRHENSQHHTALHRRTSDLARAGQQRPY